jgi:hypothetical protein
MLTNIRNTKEWKDKLEVLHQIKDRPVCIFVLNKENIPLTERIQVLDYTPELDKTEGLILIVCFNQEIKVEDIQFCEVCGCHPCDCHWGDY